MSNSCNQTFKTEKSILQLKAEIDITNEIEIEINHKDK